jgi:hypothetical protein
MNPYDVVDAIGELTLEVARDKLLFRFQNDAGSCWQRAR